MSNHTLHTGAAPYYHVRLAQSPNNTHNSRGRAGAPPTPRFDLRSNWRIFQAQTVPDIITSMLAEQKLTDIRSEICFEHQPREYCVQAGETDLDLIARLAAEKACSTPSNTAPTATPSSSPTASAA